MFLRKTETSQADSTIDTALAFFAQLDQELYTETDDSLFRIWNGGRTIRLPSEQALRRYHVARRTLKGKSERKAWLDSEGAKWCGFIEFRGLPNSGVSQSKLRGFECSFLALVEADQMEQSDFSLSLACLRWKGAAPETCDENGFIRDTCVIVDTNPPSPSHWIAKLEEAEAKKPEADREMEFWHISTYENEHNLPPHYIERQILLPYAGNEAMIQRMLWGQYADAYAGQPVYYAYSSQLHEWDELPWLRGAICAVGMDVGTMNASVIGAVKEDSKGRLHVWLLREIILEGSDTERQAVTLLKVLAEEFPWWNTQSAICPETIFYCDPAARNSSFTDNRKPTASALKVLNSHGIFPGYKIGLGLQPSFATVNRLLQQSFQIEAKNADGEMELKSIYQFRISRKGCPSLCNGFRGKYRYAEIGEPSHGSDEPMKGPVVGGIDHVCVIAGTMIETDHGARPIESIKAGEMVLTRVGFRRVLKSWKTSQAAKVMTLSAGGFKITATPDHPIWIEGKGWKKLESCISMDRITVCRQISSSMGSSTPKTATATIGGEGIISQMEPLLYIGRFGKAFMARLLTGFMSIIKTTTRRITGLKILNAFHHPTTRCFIGRKGNRRRGNAGVAKSLFGHEACIPFISVQGIAKHGIERNPKSITSLYPAQSAEKRYSGIDTRWGNPCAENAGEEKWREKGAKTSFQSQENAPSAGSDMNHGRMILEPAFAQISACEPHAENRESMTSNGSVNSAGNLSWQTKPITESIALEHAPITLDIRLPVFNITVEDEHEYFANGLLVSNCDAGRYLIANVLDIDFEQYDERRRANYSQRENPESNRNI